MAVRKDHEAAPVDEGAEIMQTAEETATESAKEANGGKDTTGQKNAPQEATEGAGVYAYVGPSLPRGKLQTGAIFSGGKAAVYAYLSEEITKHPKIKNLIVPVEALAESRAKVQQTGNAFSRYYIELAAELNV